MHIREILRLVLDIKGKTLRKLNELVGQTSKFELQSIVNVHAKVIMVRHYHYRDFKFRDLKVLGRFVMKRVWFCISW